MTDGRIAAVEKRRPKGKLMVFQDCFPGGSHETVFFVPINGRKTAIDILEYRHVKDGGKN
jgi:hypothetical protein